MTIEFINIINFKNKTHLNHYHLSYYKCSYFKIDIWTSLLNQNVCTCVRLNHFKL